VVYCEGVTAPTADDFKALARSTLADGEQPDQSKPAIPPTGSKGSKRNRPADDADKK
jgi:hypothetical protein